jgi:Tfp pilus assembly protein PilF
VLRVWIGSMVLLLAGGLATIGWIVLRPVATPVQVRVAPARRAVPVAVPAPAPAVARGVTVRGTPPPVLSAMPDRARRSEAEALLASARDARRAGDLRGALALLRTAVERVPAVETHGALGAFYLALGVTGAAESNLRTAVEGDPENADRWIALANALRLKPDPLAAAAALERARVAEPGLRVTRGSDGWLVREPPP